ncbi:hypothetical protein HOLleu_00949 [Holothuria leucospilota]|uniref:Uncharacterized protein n=1 Tax=Holothuria leucospilota TaxID=206669 RepID=A0A9Q1HKN0_HOLLE|nr:hypothetical protein HOLleu_00949 [Holothuria leucospilota]
MHCKLKEGANSPHQPEQDDTWVDMRAHQTRYRLRPDRKDGDEQSNRYVGFSEDERVFHKSPGFASESWRYLSVFRACLEGHETVFSVQSAAWW